MCKRRNPNPFYWLKPIGVASVVMLSSGMGCSVVAASQPTKPGNGFSVTSVLKQARTLVEHHHFDQAITLLEKVAHAQHSGLAYLTLGNLQRSHHPQHAIQAYLQAARYGYPNAYRPIGQIYKKGSRHIIADPLLAACYDNVAQPHIDPSLVKTCDEKRAGEFIHHPNEGIQSDEEAQLFVHHSLAQFCQGMPARLFNTQLHARTLTVIRQQLCQHQSNKKASFLNKGDLVLKDQQVFQYISNQLLLYHNLLTPGTVVYEQQPDYRALIYQHGQFMPAPDGTMVTDSTGHKQVIHGQHLEPMSGGV